MNGGKQFRDFEEILTDENGIDLIEVLQHHMFGQYLDNSDERLIKFLINHKDDVIKIYFGQQKAQKDVVSRCGSVIRSFDPIIRKEFLDNQDFLDFLFNYPKTMKTQGQQSIFSFFSILPSLVYDNDALRPQFSTLEFFDSLIQNADYSRAFDFVANFLASKSPTIIAYLQTQDMVLVFTKYIIGQEFINIQCQKLVVIAIKNGYMRGTSYALLYENRISYMIDDALKKSRKRAPFQFISSVYQTSYENNTLSSWKEIQNIIESRVDDYCKIIMNDKVFLESSNGIALLLSLIIKCSKKFTSNEYEVLKYLSSMFFVNQTNSFLHTTTLFLYSELAKAGILNRKMVEELSIITKIIETYKIRNKLILASYWGPIRILAHIVDQYVNQKNRSDWHKYVVEEINSIEKIIGSNNNKKNIRKRRNIIPKPDIQFGSRHIMLIMMLILLIVLYVCIMLKIEYIY